MYFLKNCWFYFFIQISVRFQLHWPLFGWDVNAVVFTSIQPFSTGRNRCVSSNYPMPFWPSCQFLSISKFFKAKHFKFPFSIRHVRGRVLAALANGQVAIFARSATDGEWDLSAYWLLELAPPTVAVRCLTRVHSTVWAAFRNKIAVIDPESLRVEVFFWNKEFPRWSLDLNFYFVCRLALKLIRVKKVKSGSCVESAMESGFLSDWILLFDSSMLMISVTFRTLMLNLTSPKCSVLYLIEFDSNWNFCLLKILSKRNRKVRIFIRPHYVDDD